MCINVDGANNNNNVSSVQAVLSGNTEVPARNLHQHIQNLMQVHIYNYLQYRVSSKTVLTWLFALLSASSHANCKSWDVF